MVRSIFSSAVQQVINQAKKDAVGGSEKEVSKNGEKVKIPVPFPSPEDWRDRAIYFLLVDRFNNPDETRVPPSFEEVTNTALGGTFKGITSRLDYLKSLGMGAIWLTPVFRNTKDSIHGYSIQDFLNVDPRFGTEADLNELIDQAHARGIYIIFDIVINHAGDVFSYTGAEDEAYGYKNEPYDILWRKGDGTPHPGWRVAPRDISADDPDLTQDAAVFPDEIRVNDYFRRCGKMGADEKKGDFASLKEFKTEFTEYKNFRTYYPVRDLLIKIHQYIIAKFDIDGYRIDTIKHIERDFSLVFGNAMREFALSIGKKNFMTFGEAKSGDEKVLAAYTGRYASDPDGQIGLDSTLDFPLMWTLQGVCKGFSPPAALAGLYEYRKSLLKGETEGGKVLISSHGEASRFYVTFIDNHDEKSRYRHCPRDNDINVPYPFDGQVFIALACLFTLQGIPCLYYGTEQGLRGAGGEDWCVREPLWGKPGGGFNTNLLFFKEIQQLGAVRAEYPALRYGRQYFRPVSGNGNEFGLSPWPGGIISFSRILNDTEIVILANTNTQSSFKDFFAIVDFDLNPPESPMEILYSNQNMQATQPGLIVEKQKGVIVHEANGTITDGPVCVVPFSLQPMEIQIIGKKLPKD